MRKRLELVAWLLLSSCILQTPVVGADPVWKKHVVMELGHCNTAVAIDVDEDQRKDVIAS